MTAGGGKAVFLDRDGVLTVPHFRDGRSYAPRRLEDFELYADAQSSVERLKSAGFILVVITNQPDVGAGLMSEAVLDQMHAELKADLAIDDIEVCTDTRENATDRRKPGAGMLMDAAGKWNIDLKASYVVGDRATDIEAGIRAGCTNIFIDRGYVAETAPVDQAATVTEFDGAVEWILQENARRARPDGQAEAQSN